MTGRLPSLLVCGTELASEGVLKHIAHSKPHCLHRKLPAMRRLSHIVMESIDFRLITDPHTHARAYALPRRVSNDNESILRKSPEAADAFPSRLQFLCLLMATLAH